MIGICTDSNAQLPPELTERFDIEVVPITVTIDSVDYLEGQDLSADDFYSMFADGHTPVVSTSQPSPGQFAAAYDTLLSRGCTSILSVHVASSVSGTLNSARLAARQLPIPVRLVDSGTASFGVGCCTWAAAQAVRDGANLDQAAAIAGALAPQIGNVFVVGALDLIHRGGRAVGDLDGDGIAVLSLIDGAVQVIDRAQTMVDAVNSMASYVLQWGDLLNVAVGNADAAGAALSDALASAVGESANVIEVLNYRIGPSVGAHTGPGTAGCFVFPADFYRRASEDSQFSLGERRRWPRESS